MKKSFPLRISVFFSLFLFLILRLCALLLLFLLLELARAALDDSVGLQHRLDRAEEALAVKSEAHLLDVLAVELRLERNFKLVSAVDLCPTGQSRLYVIRAVLVALLDQIELIPEGRAGTDDAHTAAEYIEELGELVKAGLAQKSAHLGDPTLRIIQLVRGRVVRGVGAHRAELEDVEMLFVNSDSLLLEEYGALAVDLDRNGDNEHRQG